MPTDVTLNVPLGGRKAGARITTTDSEAAWLIRRDLAKPITTEPPPPQPPTPTPAPTPADNSPTAPPTYAPKGDWVAHAERLDIETDGKTKDELIAAVEQEGWG